LCYPIHTILSQRKAQPWSWTQGPYGPQGQGWTTEYNYYAQPTLKRAEFPYSTMFIGNLPIAHSL